jgi:hypothetical protein
MKCDIDIWSCSLRRYDINITHFLLDAHASVWYGTFMPAMKIKDVAEKMGRVYYMASQDKQGVMYDPIKLLAEVYQVPVDRLKKMIDKKVKELQDKGGQE